MSDMTKKIFKYRLPTLDFGVSIQMRAGARILSVGFQDKHLYAWAMVDLEASLADRHIRVYGTGEPLGADIDAAVFLGTVQANGFVWHVFDHGEQP